MDYTPITGDKITAEDLRKLYDQGWFAYQESFEYAREAIDMYHGRQLTQEQLAILEQRGQPKEIFNCLKLYTRYMRGYYSNQVNTVRITAQQREDIHKASVLNDLVNYIFRRNQFESVGDTIKLDGMLTGIFCCYKRVQLTGETDEMGNPIKEIVLEHVPSMELILDPLSRRIDYTKDARYLHRFKWVHADDVIRMFGKAKFDKIKDTLGYMENNMDELNYNRNYYNTYNEGNFYNIVHTIYRDINNDYWCYFWTGDVIIKKYKITDDADKFPYRVVKLVDSEIPEFYGVFKDIIETQKSINQAIIKIQLTVNTQKIFIEQGAVDDINKFINDVNSVSGVAQVKHLSKIQIEKLGPEIRELYNIVINGLDRIQKVLGINDAFRGEAYAQDSGRKVKIQQQSTIVALQYLTDRINQFYRLLARDVVNLVKTHYKAHQVVQIVDEYSGSKWLEINKPARRMVTDESGEPVLDENGEIKTQLVTFHARDEDGSPIYNEKGEAEYGAVYLPESEINIDQIDIEVDTASYNDEQEKDALFLEGVIQGAPGAFMQATDPQAYAETLSLAIRNMKTRYSPRVAELLLGSAQKIRDEGNQPVEDPKQTDGRRISPKKEVIGNA